MGDFLIDMVVMTAALGVTGYILLKIGEESPFFGIIGAFLMSGAAGGACFSSWMFAVLVSYKVGELTFKLLGYLCAIPFVVGPIWLLFVLLSGRNRHSDGRGFEDGDGSN